MNPVSPSVVLVVDDHEDVRTLYAEHLTTAGFHVLTARDGQEAVALAADEAPNAVVMDLQMPRVDGWEATRAIRARHGRAPYVIVVTAYPDGASRREAYEAGADDLVGKPLLPDTLVAILRAAMRER